MTAIARTASPVQLAIYNYPAFKPDINAIKDIALDRLTIAQSTIDNKLLNILDGLKCKQITVTTCTMKNTAKDILSHSAEEISFDRCRIVTSFKTSGKYEKLHDFGIMKFEDGFAAFKPSLRDLAQKQSFLFDESLVQGIDTPTQGAIVLEELQKLTNELAMLFGEID